MDTEEEKKVVIKVNGKNVEVSEEELREIVMEGDMVVTLRGETMELPAAILVTFAAQYAAHIAAEFIQSQAIAVSGPEELEEILSALQETNSDRTLH